MSNSILNGHIFMTAIQVAKMLNVSPQFVRNLVRSGLIRGVALKSVGPKSKRRMIRIHPDALDEYLRRHCGAKKLPKNEAREQRELEDELAIARAHIELRRRAWTAERAERRRRGEMVD